MNVQMHGYGHLDTRKILGAEGTLPLAWIGPLPKQSSYAPRAQSEMSPMGRGSSSQSRRLVLADTLTSTYLGLMTERPRASGLTCKSGNVFVLGQGCSHSA